MFGSGAVAQVVYNALRTRPVITAALGASPNTRIYNLSAAPPTEPGIDPFPMALHYMENGTYSGPFSDEPPVGDPIEETIRYVVRFICRAGEGSTSDGPIRPAAKDAFETLAAVANEPVAQGGDAFNVTLLPIGEWPITTVIEGGVMYRQLGFYLTAHVFRAAAT